MSDHPRASTLSRFIRGELRGQEARSVAAHLLLGCVRCRRVVASFAASPAATMPSPGSEVAAHHLPTPTPD
ncbi:MAG: hypothetical protein M3O15_13905, partial [Acidobacteriota bacterium]|nr:hypothetical protein [Acidobacteriota bacterium]